MSSKGSIASALAAVAFLALGFILPQLFPELPFLWRWLIFGLAVVLLVLALILRMTYRSTDEGHGAGPAITQSHSGIGHNIVTDSIHLGRSRFELTDGILNQIAAKLDISRPVAVVWRGGGRGDRMKDQLIEFLTTRGFTIGAQMGLGTITGVEFDQPLTISPNGFDFGGVKIFGGAQVVAIEPNAS